MDKSFMDNKEAIEVIRSNWPPANRTQLIEALELSIKTLEAAEALMTVCIEQNSDGRCNMTKKECPSECPICRPYTI